MPGISGCQICQTLSLGILSIPLHFHFLSKMSIDYSFAQKFLRNIIRLAHFDKILTH